MRSFRLPRTGRGGDGTEGRGGALRLTLALKELQLELSLGAESPPFSFQLGREWDGRDSSCGTKQGVVSSSLRRSANATY